MTKPALIRHFAFHDRQRRWLSLFCAGFFFLICKLTSYAQAPVITAKSPVKVILDQTGNYNVKLADVATVSSADPKRLKVGTSPATFDCTTLGPQTVTVTATNLAAPRASFHSPSALAFDDQGNLYVADLGNYAVRKISPGGQVTTLAGRGTPGNIDGPDSTAAFGALAAIALDNNHNVYVSDNGNYEIRKISPNGQVSILAGKGSLGTENGTGRNAGFAAVGGLFFDGIVTLYTGDAGKIRKVGLDGTVTDFAGGTSAFQDGPVFTALFNFPHAITRDAQGNLLLTDENNHRVRMISTANVVSTVSSALINPTGIALDQSGNIFVADGNANVIRKIAPDGTVSVFAGSGNRGAANGKGTSASFDLPVGLAFDRAGNLFVADDRNNEIRMITPDGDVSTYAGNTTPGFVNGDVNTVPAAADETSILQVPVTVQNQLNFATYPNVTVLANDQCQAQLPDYTLKPLLNQSCTSIPVQVTQFPLAGTLVSVGAPVTVTLAAADGYGAQASVSFTVTARSKPKITPVAQPVQVTLDASGNYVAKLADLATVINCDGSQPNVQLTPSVLTCTNLGLQQITITAGNGTLSNTTPGAASFNYPQGIAVDQNGNIYISDEFNHKIKKISFDGIVSSLAGKGVNGFSEGKGTAAGFNYPQGLVCDPAGNIYVADYQNNRIRQVTPDGLVSTFAGNGSTISSDGQRLTAGIVGPSAVTIDQAGNFYISEYAGNKIRKITPDGAVSILAGTGATGQQNGSGNIATFLGLEGICADRFGNVYVAAAGNQVIRKITPDGTVSTFAGVMGVAGYQEGERTTALFNNPIGLAIDFAGNIYVGDGANQKVRKISTDGTVSTLAPGWRFNAPEALAIDPDGNVIVADRDRHSIFRINMDGTVTTIAGTGSPGDQTGVVGVPDITMASQQVTINVNAAFGFTSVFKDVILAVTGSCPIKMPDFTSTATAAGSCSRQISFQQSPLPGTIISASQLVTITATDELGHHSSVSFKVSLDGQAPPPPSVSIVADKLTACQGAPVVFHAIALNAGSAPVFQWLVNGQATGPNSDIFGTTSLTDQAVVSCILKTADACSTAVTSNPLTITIQKNLTPAITITATAMPVCQGVPVTFTAQVTNGGGRPTFQWAVNHVTAGGNGSSFTPAVLAEGDVIDCTVVNNDGECLAVRAATATPLTAHIITVSTPAISITGPQGTNCPGAPVTFKANASNAQNVHYQWLVNGLNAGTDAVEYTSTSFRGGEQVSCRLLCSDPCVTLTQTLSNTLTVTINNTQPATVSFTADHTDACAGDPVSFTASASPAAGLTYQWLVNGKSTGSNSNTYSSASWQDGDQVSCTVAGPPGCILPGTSNSVTVHIHELPVIAAIDAITIKRGASIQLQPLIKGDIIAYNWAPSTALSNSKIASPIANPDISTKYELTVTSSSGCQAHTSVQVNVATAIIIPNTFTPNGDGVNDLWVIDALNYYPKSTVDIFNRYGQVVYHATGIGFSWSGIAGGKPQPAGVYYYLIDLNDGSKPYSGSIALIR